MTPLRFVFALAFAAMPIVNHAVPTPSVDRGDPVARTVQVDGITYRFLVFVPSGYKPTAPLPAILLIHGAGGNGLSMLSTWQSFAESHNIVLVAPTLELSATAEARVPVVFPRIMDAVQGEWSVDRRRLYVFGYSAGGYFAYDAALLNSEYFAAGGVFAGIIQPEYDGIARQATRRTGIAVYIGDRDQFFSVAQARRTRDVLQANHVDVRYVELPNQDHNYGAAASFVNADVWRFFSAHVLRP